MKIKILLILLLLIVCGCENKNDNANLQNYVDETSNKQNISDVEEGVVEDIYIDNNPIKLGLYLYTNSATNRKLLSEYNTEWIVGVDLCSLEVYYTNEESISGTSQKQVWYSYYDRYENIENYKIGYNIEFDTTVEKINKTILSPEDTNEIFNYIQIYLYDDIHQNGGWYSHITKEEYNDDSILSSIKLTGSDNTDKIISDITLTAFTYDQDDFNENNEYRGSSKFVTIIKRK